MPLPRPVPGLVIRYSYLWRREYLQGIEEGQKDRPAAIVAAVDVQEDGLLIVVLPITHTEPDQKTPAVEIPMIVKNRLGLDADRSWIMLSEYNEFLWPGPDLRRIGSSDDSSITYGMLPPRLFEMIKQKLRKYVDAGLAKPVRRTES